MKEKKRKDCLKWHCAVNRPKLSIYISFIIFLCFLLLFLLPEYRAASKALSFDLCDCFINESEQSDWLTPPLPPLLLPSSSLPLWKCVKANKETAFKKFRQTNSKWAIKSTDCLHSGLVLIPLRLASATTERRNSNKQKFLFFSRATHAN